MNPLVPLGVVTIGILALVFRRRPSAQTAWTGEGLPRPVVSVEQLGARARELAGFLHSGVGLDQTIAYEPDESGRQNAVTLRGMIRRFQREAGMAAVENRPMTQAQRAEYERVMTENWGSVLPYEPNLGVTGQYDPITRRALGFYGRLWQEETP